MSDKSQISASQLAKLEVILAALRWRSTFAAALEHRKVRRVAPDEPGTRFICRDEDGVHACASEEIDPDQQLDLYDLVPKNRAATLETLLAESSDSRGALNDGAWALLMSEAVGHGASETQLARLETHRHRDAAGAFFVAVEVALDTLKLPQLQWRNGVDEHGSPR
jgi:hypothetical protein